MRLSALLLALLLVAATLGSARAAEQVRVRAAGHDKEGFGRIAFDWPAPVGFEAKIDGQTLTITFARPLAAKLGAIAKHLAEYVARARIGEDGTSLIAELKRPAQVRSFSEGKTIAVDIVTGPAPAATPRPAKPARHAKPAKASPAATADAEPAPAPKPETETETASQPAAPAETAATPAAPAPAHETASAPAAPAATPSVSLSFSDHEGGRRVVLDWHGPVHYLFHQAEGLAQFRFAHPFSLDTDRLAAELPDLSPNLGTDAGKTVLRFALPKGTRLVANHTATTIVVDVLTKSASTPAKPAAAHPPPAKTAPPADGVVPPPELVEPSASPPEPAPPPPSAPSPPKRPAAALPPPAGSLPVHYALAPQGASLRFDWGVPPPAAVFRRGSGIWIVFSGVKLLDLSEPRRAAGEVITRLDQLPQAKATVLRLVPREGINPSVRRTDEGWVVEFKPQQAGPDAPLTLEARPDAETAEAFFSVSGAGEPIMIRDPEVGDMLAVVPVSDVGRGIGAAERLVDFSTVPSVQGIVLRPNGDDLRVNLVKEGVRVTRPGGLLLSGSADRKLAEEPGGPRRLLDFAGWRGPDDETYLKKRSRLEQAVAAAASAARTRPRLALARFYFANLYAAEAEGVLEAVRRDDPGAAAQATQLLLGGATALLLGDHKAAADLLGSENLANEPEAQLWRAALAAETRDWPAAAQGFAQSASFLPRYPKPLAARFALAAARALIETGQASEAQPMLDLVLKRAPTPDDRAEAIYLQGKRLLALGQAKPAIELWDQVAATADRHAHTEARFARTVAALDANEMSRGDAIKALDELRFAWRGDGLEFALLRKLGELKLADGDPRGAFDSWREAAGDFPDLPQAKDVTKELADGVAKMFMGNELENLPPLKAVTLYDDYKDYVPVGERGDAIARRLIDRLVSVDLLDRAAALLEEQVTHRLTGRDKARGATQLALIRLLDHRPSEALKALDIDVGKDVAPELLRQRQQLRARSLFELKRVDEALAILANDTSRDADRLRADIFWQTRNWPEAAKAFAHLVPPPGTATLDRAQSLIVLDWASALTLAGDQGALADLRTGYGPAMAASAYADAFRIIAGDPAAPADGDPRTIANRVAQVGELQSFMTDLKQRLQKDKLSAIN